MGFRPHPPPTPGQVVRDPVRDLPENHLARFVERVVEETLPLPSRPPGPGQPAYDPRLCLKVLVYGYATGTRSTRQLERLCQENLAYLFLTRGEAPSYHTLCTARLELQPWLEAVWIGLFAIAFELGMKRIGHIVVDSTKLRASASPEAVVKREEFAAVRNALQQILAAAQQVDAREDQEGYPGKTQLEQAVPPAQMRDILRRVRKRLAKQKRQATSAPPDSEPTQEAGSPSRRKKGSRKGGAPEAVAPKEEGDDAGSSAEGATPQALAPEGKSTAAASSATGDPEPPLWLHPRMRQRVKEALAALVEAEAEGRKHLCLTDPDARMMPEGREKKRRECHSFEVAVDRGDGLLVVGQTSQEGNDNERLEVLVAAARAHEPEGVRAADGDSGYYSGDALGRLMEQGVDCCVPDPHTASDLHRGQLIGTTRARAFDSEIPLIYDAEADLFRCPEGNELKWKQHGEGHGQQHRVYKAERSCEGCPLAARCLMQVGAKYRTVKVGAYQKELAAAQARFAEPEDQERYRHRGEAVETVFGFVRGVWGYTRWLLRGRERVACEGRLLRTAYQLRKVHAQWARS
jgi:Transposase DDE domain/Transposase domain (DUF772)